MSWYDGLLDDRGIDWPRAVLLGVGLAVVLAVGVVATTSTAAFNPYNPSWDGSSDLRDQLENETGVESDLLRETTRYEEVDAEGTTVFVVAPEASYSEADAASVREFVEDGGRLVVFENVGDAGNDLLADVGAEARVDGRILRDEYHHANGPTMPIATGVQEHSLTTDVEQLTLNYATAVEPNTASVLVTTSSLATLGDSAHPLDATAYPVATAEGVGAGTVVVVGDPSLTINAMIDQPDNADFLRDLYVDSDRVLLDVTHASEIPPLTAAVLAVRDTPLLQLTLGGAGIAAVGLWSSGLLGPTLERARRWRSDGRVRSRETSGTMERGTKTKTETETETERELTVTTDTALGGTIADPGLSRSERAEFLRDHHPEWEEERVQRALEATARTENRLETGRG
ncbi:DUF4350 domain-containing protein [Natronoglomus mannanivorans]|uniref:DUF4350 domain-containing protein n=1 Tax=Natronoglomus mannanivorans TaxID=2979990 RepID=A0AAP3E225_9EURY|nr:DUF4350 domain-containing protein [Halobacteria archaeon AArc-xg1-1]